MAMTPVRRWTFRDVHGTGPEPHSYTFEINPNEGGSPQVEKQMAVSTRVGPGRTGILQEGSSNVPTLEFTGTILTREFYEALELWYDRRILLEIVDDLGRTFWGVLTAFSPQRQRRGYRFWYHTWTGSFSVYRYWNASGQEVYGPARPRPALGRSGNLLTNHSFEAPFVAKGERPGFPTGWQEGNDDEPMDHVSVFESANTVHGRQLVQLFNRDPNKNSFLEQLVEVDYGRWLQAEASYFCDGPIGPAFGDRGLMLSVTEYEEGSPHGKPGTANQSNTPITATSLVGRWVRLTTRCYVPTQVERPVVQVRLYAPGLPPDWPVPDERLFILWDDAALYQE